MAKQQGSDKMTDHDWLVLLMRIKDKSFKPSLQPTVIQTYDDLTVMEFHGTRKEINEFFAHLACSLRAKIPSKREVEILLSVDRNGVVFKR
jgi:hypothetical protein